MDATEIIKSFNGFLWEAIYEIKPENYIESVDSPSGTDVVLGPMTELEKALFSIKFSLLSSIITFFGVNEEDDSEIEDFYVWIVTSPQIEFLSEYTNGDTADDEIGLIEQETVLLLRSQFLAAHDFLKIITCQRFGLFAEDVVISYRKNNLVTITPTRLMEVSQN